MKKHTPAFKKLMAYVLDCINEIDGDGNDLKTTKDKVAEMAACFQGEFNNEWNIKKWPFLNRRLKEWLQGMGGPIGLDHDYAEILKRGHEFGYEITCEDHEQWFCETWFELCADALLALAEEHGVRFSEFDIG